MLAIGFLLVALAYLILRSDELPISAGDGTYSNSCCGSLKLQRGTMQMGQQTVSYKVKQDKAGGYVIPRFYIYVEGERRFEVDRTHNPLEIRMSSESAPNSLELMTDDGVYT